MTFQILLRLLCATLLPTAAALAGEWDTTPLGKPVQEPKEAPVPIKQPLESRFRALPAEGVPTVLFDRGEPRCLLVVPASPSGVEMKAATLLKTTLEGMTGAKFTLCRETGLHVQESEGGTLRLSDSENRAWPCAIWIGKTSRAAKESIQADGLNPEGYRLVTRGPWLFLVGRDLTASHRGVEGTYFAAVSLLECHLGVRWLWPGEVGTVLPKSSRVVLPPIHEQDEPALPVRTIRNLALNDRARVGLELLQADAADYEKLLNLNAAWLANQRTGSSLNLQYRHAFGDWYERFGAAHPDWFALQPNGSRKQYPERIRLCESNPEVAHRAAEQVIAAYAKDPNLDCASISPNDGGSHNFFCMCEACRKLDPANGNRVTLLFSRDGKRFETDYPSLTNRIATFYNRVADEVAKTLPDARIGAYAYSAYRDAPLGIQLRPSILIGFVGLNYTDETRRKIDLARWDAWGRHASKLLLRPNAFHSGEGLPLVYVHRLGSDIKHCYQTGMAAADFDSLIGNWATEGLNYYLLAKLLWDPSADIDSIVKDYCRSGFGAAADEVERYFAAIEEATGRVADQSQAEAELPDEGLARQPKPSKKRQRAIGFQKAYFNAFTPGFIASLHDLLRQAEEKAAGEKDVLARIAFLKTGLDYAEAYQASLEGKRDVKQQLLDWHRETFHSQPLAVNSVYRLWKSAYFFRNLK